MCKHGKDHQQRSGSFMHGTMLGMLVGVVAGIMLAPAQGKETREKVRKTASDLKSKSQPLLDNFEEKVIPVLEKVQQAVAEAGQPLKAEITEKIDRLADDVDKRVKSEKKNLKKKLFAGVKRAKI